MRCEELGTLVEFGSSFSIILLKFAFPYLDVVDDRGYRCCFLGSGNIPMELKHALNGIWLQRID